MTAVGDMDSGRGLGLTDTQLYEKVYGGWLGKNIGGTLGGPLEGQKEPLSLTFYGALPDGPLKNDDLDLQLVWLHALEVYGPRVTARELGQEWAEHVFFPFDEYGYAAANLRRGLIAPLAGWFNNPFTDCMGSPIRSEIWAMVAPGRPDVAAYYAWHDAVVDHAGGEGVWGEMFFAALQAAAFIEHERDRLIEIGLGYIPAGSRTARAVRDTVRWHTEGRSWQENRARILDTYGHWNFTDAPQNIAFTVLGWLYGRDFGDAILTATNCGYDTDCTAATLGAILGILVGADSLPPVWAEPVGDRVVVSPEVVGLPAPADLDALTRRTLAIGREIAAYWRDRTPDIAALLARNVRTDVVAVPCGVGETSGLAITIDYGTDGPAIGRGETKPLTFILTNHSAEEWLGTLAVTVPKDWDAGSTEPLNLPPHATQTWQTAVRAGDVAAPSHALALQMHRTHDTALWRTETVPFALVQANRWTLFAPGATEGVDVAFPGNRVDFAALDTGAPGVYRATTTLVNGTAKELRLKLATELPLRAALNGDVIYEDPKPLAFGSPGNRGMNFHGGDIRVARLHLPAGECRLTVELTKGDAPLEIWVVPVSIKETTRTATHGQRGFYYHLDVLFV